MMAEVPEALITHVSQGRVRLRVPAKRRDTGFFTQLGSRLAPLPGVEKVEVNPVTGSVLVLHRLNLTSRADVDSLAASLPVNGLITLSPPPRVPEPQRTPPVSLARSLATGLAGLSEQIRGVTGGIVDVPTLVIAGLVVVSVRQWQRGAVFMPAATALWYASSLLKDQMRESRAEAVVAGSQ